MSNEPIDMAELRGLIDLGGLVFWEDFLDKVDLDLDLEGWVRFK